MILRLLNSVVIGALVLAAAYVYQIKFEFDRPGRTARQAARRDAARTRSHRRRCAPNGASSTTLRASRLWPSAICRSSRSTPTQFDSFDRLPERPPNVIQPDSSDPIGAMIENLEEPETIDRVHCAASR